jgi:hypothetical protein
VAGNKVIFGITGADAAELAKEFKIVVPEPAVTGYRPKYEVVPNPLQHLATHGHEHVEVVKDYQRLRRSLDRLFAFLHELLSDRERRDLEFRTRAPHSYQRFGGAGAVLPSDYQTLRLKQAQFERDLDAHYYRIMTAPTHEAYIEVTHSYRSNVAAALDEIFAVVDPGLPPMVQLIRQRWDAYQAAAKAVLEQHRGMVADGSHLKEAADDWMQKELAQLEENRPTPELFSRQLGDHYVVSWRDAFWLYESLEGGLLFDITVLRASLRDHPCLAATGQTEPILDKPRLYSDVEAEIANTLATLPRFTARCKLIAHGQAHEHTLRTNDRPETAGGAAAGAQAIKQNARRLYGRERAAVEGAIADRLQRPSPPPVRRPQVPKREKEDRDFWQEG